MNLNSKIFNYLRSLEGMCADCLRKQYCDNCHIKTAKMILADIKSLNTPVAEIKQSDNSLSNRIRIIIECLSSANRPLLSKEIYIPNCSKELKEWTINNLLARHQILRRRRKDSSFYEYFLPHKKRKHNG